MSIPFTMTHVPYFYAFVESAVFNVLRLAVGRAGEVGLFRWRGEDL